MSNSQIDEEIFAAALRIPTIADRMAYLDQACAGDAGQRVRIARLLAALDDAGSFLNKPLADVAAMGATLESAANGSDCSATAARVPLDFLAPSDRPETLGKLGPYIVEDVIGRGGMGIVLRAIDPKLNRVVAIKVLSPEFAQNPMAGKRFLREAQAAAAVSHDHVVRIYAVDDASSVPFLVMECIIGQSLQQKIERKGILEIREILRIGHQIAAGLAAAHKQGLVHRDIKPANILLENGIERVKITDFGLARAVDDVGITQSGQVTGTPQYMSPEQAMGEPVDHRSDLFSLGSVLYTMCTGRPAFRATSTVAVLRRVVDDTPRPIRELNAEAPDWLIKTIDRLMSKNPDGRFQTAGEVATLLEQWLAHYQRPQTVPAPTQTEAVTRTVSPTGLIQATLRRGWDSWWSRRSRGLVIAVQVVLVLLHCYCMLRFLNVHMSRVELDGRVEFRYFVGYPAPWYRFEINRSPQLGFTSHSSFELISWSVALGVLGYGLYYAVWCIERARHPKPGWWNHPFWAMTLWGLLAAGAIGLGMVEGYSELEVKPANSLASSSPAPSRPAPSSNQSQALEGRWQVVRQESGGTQLPGDLQSKWWEFAGSKRREQAARNVEVAECEFRVDFQKNPCEIDLLSSSQVVQQGIFELRGDELTVCFSTPPARRAKTFSTRLNTSLFLTVLRRGPSSLSTQESWAANLGVPVEFTNGMGMKFRLIPPGNYLKGSSPKQVATVLENTAGSDWYHALVRSESPPMPVTIDKPFYLGTYEVTYDQFARFADATSFKTEVETNGLGGNHWDQATNQQQRKPEYTWRNKTYTPHGDEPVKWLAPADMLAFCKWLSDTEKAHYELPTDDQWEYACRAGTTTLWSCGDDPNMAVQFGNFGSQMAQGGSKPANAFGLFDMHGNALELTVDRDGSYWNRSGNVGQPAWYGRSAHRGKLALFDVGPLHEQGLRVALSVDDVQRELQRKHDNPLPAKSAAVLTELTKQVDFAATEVEVMRARYMAAAASQYDINQAEQRWNLAKLRLAEAQGESPAVIGLARVLVQLAEQNVVIVQDLIKAGRVVPQELQTAEKELRKARLRLAELQPDNPPPLPPSLPQP